MAIVALNSSPTFKFTMTVISASFPLTRKGTPAYYLNLGDLIYSFSSNENLDKNEPQVNGVLLSKVLESTAKVGSWLSDPEAAINNGNWSSGPVSVPGYDNEDINPWPEKTENLAIYFVDAGALGRQTLWADLGIDNQLAIWVNGEYRYGVYRPVHYDVNDLPYRNVDLGPLKPGLNAIQIFRGDEFGWAGADWVMTAKPSVNAVKQISYAVIPTPNPVNEGSLLQVTVRVDGADAGATYYWQLAGQGVDSTDFEDGKLTGSAAVNAQGEFVVNPRLAMDAKTEGRETVEIRLYKDAALKEQVGSMVSVSVNDTSMTSALNTKPVVANVARRFRAMDAGRSVAISPLFSVVDAENDRMIHYNFLDSSKDANTGYFVFNGTSYQGKGLYAVKASELDKVFYVPGLPGSSEDVWIGASDGKANSDWAKALWQTEYASSPESTIYTVSAASSRVSEGQPVQVSIRALGAKPGSRLYWVMSGRGIQTQDFVTGGLAGSGVVDALGEFALVRRLATDLKTEGEEVLAVKFYRDAALTSQVGSTSLVAIADTSVAPRMNAKPVVSNPVHSFGPGSVGRSVLVKTLFSVVDRDRDPIVSYNFWDGNQDAKSGYFSFNGQSYQGKSLYGITASQLDQVSYVPGSVGTSEHIWIGASDGNSNSEWAKALWKTVGANV